MSSTDTLPVATAGHKQTTVDWGAIVALLGASGPDGGLLSSQVIVKPADTTYAISSTTMQNDPDLKLPMQINGIYLAYGVINYAAATTASIKIGFTAPSGSNLRWTSNSLDPAVTGSSYGGTDHSVRSGSTPQVGSNNIGNKLGFTPVVTVNMGATPGNLQFQAAQNTSTASSAPIIGISSTLILIRIG